MQGRPTMRHNDAVHINLLHVEKAYHNLQVAISTRHVEWRLALESIAEKLHSNKHTTRILHVNHARAVEAGDGAHELVVSLHIARPANRKE